MLFQCLVFFCTVKHQCNEVLPGFGIGVSSAKLTRWEISVFSCWQSIYLPSNVEYVCGMNTERRGMIEEGRGVEIAVYVHSCSHWEMILTVGLHNSSWTITLSWNIQSHMNAEESEEPISIDGQLMLKHQQQKKDAIFFFFLIFTFEQLYIVTFPDKPVWVTDYIKILSIVYCVFHFIQVHLSVVLEVKDIPQPVLGKVAPTLKEKRHPHIMQYWLVLKSVW